jgi:hypothetical protein
MSGTGKYKDSLNLFATEFPMRGDLARREPAMLAARKERDIHGYGHVLNNILEGLVLTCRPARIPRSVPVAARPWPRYIPRQ